MINLEEALGRPVEFLGSVYDIIYPKTGSNAGARWSLIRVAVGVDYQRYALYDGAVNKRAPVGIGGFVAVSGHIPTVNPSNIVYKFTVMLENNDKYGPTYKFITMEEQEDATNQNNEIKILSHVLSNHKLKLLLESGVDPIALLRAGDVKGLSQIKGIGPITAKKLIKDYIEGYAVAKEEVSFYDLGLTKWMIQKLIDKYHSPERAKAIITTNPYQLIEDIRGIGWAKADAIAQRGGLGLYSKQRLRAYALYYLNDLANTEGHTWVPIQELGTKIKEIAPGIEDAPIIECLEDMIGSGRLYYDAPTMRIGMKLFRNLEESISEELKRLSAATPQPLEHIEESFAEAESETGYIYTDEQKDAVRMCINNSVCLITGTAGTGKSSIMLPFTKILNKNGLQFRQVALSGKAALNLSEITGETGMTIHKLLGLFRDNPEEEMSVDTDDITEEELKKRGPVLPFDVIILDELSMVGGTIFYKLIRRMRTGSRLVLLGDPGQLESIGLCNLIKDIQDSHKIPSVCLTKIHRQAALSGIVTEATKVYNQEHIVPPNFSGELVAGEKRDFKLVTAETTEECAAKALTWYNNFVKYLNATPDDICVVVAKRASGAASARVINEQIQRSLGVSGPGIAVQYSDSGINYEINYHCGDRVLVTRNNYGTIDVTTETKCPIFNGNVGTVKSIDITSQSLTVDFPQGLVEIKREDLSNIQLGYAITCHKMQGSGIKFVIYVCDPSAYSLLSKEHLYTGITRAKKLCVVIGRAYTIRFATSTTRVKVKHTWLTELLQKGETA